MRPSTYEAAMDEKSAHSLHIGAGYFRHDDHPVPIAQAEHLTSNCSPPLGTVDGSRHLLSPPGSDQEMVFTWIDAEKAWERHGGNRLAFTAAYLGAHGWIYLRPTDEPW